MMIQATGQIYPSSQSGHKQPCHTENNSVKEDIEMFHQEVPGRKDWHLSCKCASRRQPSLTASSEPGFTAESYFVWAHPLLKDSLHLVFKMVHRCPTLETRGRTLISNASPGNSDQIYHVCWVFSTVQLLWKILPPSSPFQAVITHTPHSSTPHLGNDFKGTNAVRKVKRDKPQNAPLSFLSRTHMKQVESTMKRIKNSTN
jgi:hypothetical protein